MQNVKRDRENEALSYYLSEQSLWAFCKEMQEYKTKVFGVPVREGQPS